MANILNIEERHERDEDFVRYFVQLGGNATEAARKIGITESSASTTGHRMKERLWDEIQDEIKYSIKTHVPMALHGLVKLADSADSETVRLNALKDLLDRGGLKPTEKQEIHQTNEYADMTAEQINDELQHMHDAHPPLDWLERYLMENNLKLVDTDEIEEIEAVIEHKLEQIDGKHDH